MTTPVPTTSELRVALAHTLTLLRDRRVVEAEQQAREILRVQADEINASRLLGAALRLQGRYEDAARELGDLVTRAPKFALAHQELGLCQSAAGQICEAIESLQLAVSLEPSLAVSWRALGELYLSTNDQEAAEQAFQQHLKTTTQNPELVKVVQLLGEQKIAQAERACRAYLKKYPTDVNAIRLLAEIGQPTDDADSDVIELLRRQPEAGPAEDAGDDGAVDDAVVDQRPTAAHGEDLRQVQRHSHDVAWLQRLECDAGAQRSHLYGA